MVMSRGWGNVDRNYFLMRTKFQWWKERDLEMGIYGCTAVRIYLMPLSCTLNSGDDGKLYGTYFITSTHGKDFYYSIIGESTSIVGYPVPMLASCCLVWSTHI